MIEPAFEPEQLDLPERSPLPTPAPPNRAPMAIFPRPQELAMAIADAATGQP